MGVSLLAFFNRSKKSPTIGELERESFDHLLNCLCEVHLLEPSKHLFVGRIQNMTDTAVHIFPISGSETPIALHNTALRLFVHVPKIGLQIWGGSVYGTTRDYWSVDQLIPIIKSDMRSTFRQRVSAPGRLVSLEDEPDFKGVTNEHWITAGQCTTVDVSLGGVQFTSNMQLLEGDRVHLFDLLLDPTQPRFEFTGTVRWSRDGEKKGEYKYGCSFEHMPHVIEDRLCAIILKLQREAIAREEKVAR